MVQFVAAREKGQAAFHVVKKNRNRKLATFGKYLQLYMNKF